ncbi:hypothetical protein ILUMI_01688 [Ignelater luminosus]|uniref:Uncharacterized protein n=1 Tax=Ignelater luminosus TaxID=2038154 RepID=A0A8K0GH68_IGNLU|nr:hypothetical protein ILUMI_01688 [Ignelater luminosus]
MKSATVAHEIRKIAEELGLYGPDLGAMWYIPGRVKSQACSSSPDGGTHETPTAREKGKKRLAESNRDEERRLRLQTYTNLKRQYKKEILETNNKSWQEFVERHLATDVWGLPYKIVSNRIASPSLLSCMERRDGTMTTGWQDSNERELSNFTEEEVENATNSMMRKKAHGSNGITAEVIQALQQQLIPLLCPLCNSCIRQGRFPKQAEVVVIKQEEDKDATKSKSYRPKSSKNFSVHVSRNTDKY